jgi:hypothetical protein
MSVMGSHTKYTEHPKLKRMGLKVQTDLQRKDQALLHLIQK